MFGKGKWRNETVILGFMFPRKTKRNNCYAKLCVTLQRYSDVIRHDHLKSEEKMLFTSRLFPGPFVVTSYVAQNEKKIQKYL